MTKSVYKSEELERLLRRKPSNAGSIVKSPSEYSAQHGAQIFRDKGFKPRKIAEVLH